MSVVRTGLSEAICQWLGQGCYQRLYVSGYDGAVRGYMSMVRTGLSEAICQWLGRGCCQRLYVSG